MTILNMYKQKVLDYLEKRDSKQDLTKEELDGVLQLKEYLFNKFLKEANSAGFISTITIDTGDVKRTLLLVNPFHISDKEYINTFNYKAFEKDKFFREKMKEYDRSLAEPQLKEKIKYRE